MIVATPQSFTIKNINKKGEKKMGINEYIDVIEKMMIEEDGYTNEEAAEITSALRNLFAEDEK